jgi:hypothetical protein
MSIFLSLGHFFKAQHDIFRKDVANLSRQLTASHLSSLAITLLDHCKQCDRWESRIKLPNQTAGYITHLNLTSEGLKVTSIPTEESWLTTLHGLNHSIAQLEGAAYSVRDITLIYERFKNKLEIR